MAEDNTFAAADYVVFALVMGISIAVGIVGSIVGVKERGLTQYFVGSRRLAVIPVALSLLMSRLRPNDLLGTSAEMYYFGTQAFMSNLGILLATPLSILLIVPIIYPLKLTSMLQYFQLRYHSEILHRFNGIVYILSSMLSTAIQLYGPATAFEAVTGINYQYCLGATGLIATLYTALGGLRGVVWADIFQGVVIVGGVITLLAVGANQVGGLDEVWRYSDEGQRIEFFDMDPDPTARATFWTTAIGGAAHVFMLTALGQAAVQRFSAVSSAKKGMWIFAIQVPIAIIMNMLICLIGLTIYAYYRNCDPTISGQISNANQILPHFMVNLLDVPGLPGLFIAVIFCACMSSVSTELNGSAALIYMAFVEPVLNRMRVSESRRVTVVKMIVVGFGVAVTGFSYAVDHMQGHVIQLAQGLLGGAYGPLAGSIFLGMLVPFAQWKGALIGSIAGVAFTTWINIGKQLGDDITPHVLPLVYNVTVCLGLPPPGFPGNPNVTQAPWPATTAGASPSWTHEAISSPAPPPSLSPPPGSGGEEMMALYRVSFYYMTALGFIITFFVGLVASLLTGPAKPGEVDPRTMVNWKKSLCCRFFSEKRRQKLMCGYGNPEQEDEKMKSEKQDSCVDTGKDLGLMTEKGEQESRANGLQNTETLKDGPGHVPNSAKPSQAGLKTTVNWKKFFSLQFFSTRPRRRVACGYDTAHPNDGKVSLKMQETGVDTGKDLGLVTEKAEKESPANGLQNPETLNGDLGHEKRPVTTGSYQKSSELPAVDI